MKVKKFASRAGEKLQHALDEFGMDVGGLTCADFGSSTGGFVDCLLQNGASKVYSVDTAYGELAWKLRNDEKVVVLERTNAMHVQLPEKVDLITIDTGWTKQEKILPSAFRNLKPKGSVVSLIKPHYEAPGSVRKGKLAENQVEDVLHSVVGIIEGLGGEVLKTIESPKLGERAGNKEFLVHVVRLR